MTIWKWVIALSIVPGFFAVASCRTVRGNECAAPPGTAVWNRASDAGEEGKSASDAGEENPAHPRRIWKAVLMTGDDRIPAFDNGRKKVKTLFEGDGVLGEHMIQLSRARNEQVGGVRATSIANFESAMVELDAGEGDACVVFMTSHGTASGFLIRREGYLVPSKLDQILDDACGELPTVALISACYSGIFVEPLNAPNRVVLTASRSDRASFGCTSKTTYTDWDDCLITSWDSADTWEGLHAKIQVCIQAKEDAGGHVPSLPQGFFGEDVRELRVLDR